MRYDKLSASLHATLDDLSTEIYVEDFQAADALGFDRGPMLASRAEFAPVTVERFMPDGTHRVDGLRVFLSCEADVSLEKLTALGVQIDRDVGQVRAATVPIAALDAVSESDLVRSITASVKLRPLMDFASTQVGLSDYVNREGRTGKGVVVGIVDTGIDTGHPAFAGRIDRIWDQTVLGQGVPEGSYGVEHHAPFASPPSDQQGHGTHVAGIAAGNDVDYCGVAPEATLVIVKTSFDNTQIASGVEYVFRVANDLGMPAVVNLSLGGHNDPHDGSDPLCLALDQSVGPGRIVCVSAGNEGDDAMHAARLIEADGDADFELQVHGTAPTVRVWFNSWYGLDDQMSVTVTGPNGGATPTQGVVPGNGAKSYQLSDGVVQVTTKAPGPDDLGHNVIVDIRPKLGLARVEPGMWTVTFHGDTVVNGEIHAWLMDDPDPNTEPTLFLQDTFGFRVGSPGAATQAITVGASVSRNTWESENTLGWRGLGSIGGVAAFSSPGPRRDGASKPDVLAPGSMIISARSTAWAVPEPNCIDPTHAAIQGTSMACPFATGLVALLLEGDPSLDPSSVRQKLVAAAQIPFVPTGTWTPEWGYGLVDARRL